MIEGEVGSLELAEYAAVQAGLEPPVQIEEKLTSEDEQRFTSLALEAIGNGESKYQTLEEAVLGEVHNLPDQLANQLETADVPLLNTQAETLLIKIFEERDQHNLAELQIELIYQYLGIISNAQNGGDKGFIPRGAREVSGLDCSLSALALKEKLQTAKVPNLAFQFGYPPGHAVAIIQIADGRNLYVDAQNGFVEEVEFGKVLDSENTDTAYPLFEIKSSKRIPGNVAGLGKTTLVRQGGSGYVPKYLGVQEDGLLHTLGNMHMLTNPTSPMFYTKVARDFRAGLDMPELEPPIYEAGKRALQKWEKAKASDEELVSYLSAEMESGIVKAQAYAEKWQDYYAPFANLVGKIAGGKTIHDTKFGKLEEMNHSAWKEFQEALEDKAQVAEIRSQLGLEESG